MEKNRGKNLAINTIIIGIGKFSTQIVSFLLLPLYTSILTAEEYGIYDLILTVSTFALPFITLLMEESMFRFLIDCKEEEEKKKVISQTTIYIMISSTIFLGLAAIINYFITIPYLLISIIYILTCIISGLRNALIRGLGKLKFYTIINFGASVINIILKVILIAVFRFGVYGLIISGILSNIISSLIVFITLKLNKYISIKSYDKELMKKMVSYSIPLVPNSLSWTIVNLSDRLIISGFLGTSANGIYSMSYKFPNLIDTIYGFFYTAWKESSAKAVSDNDKEQFFNKIFTILTNAMYTVSVGLIVSMPLVFNVFIKEAYSEAYLYIPILAVATYYNNMSGYFGGIFSAYKDTKIMGTTTIIGALINLIVNVALIKLIGIYAAAISTLISCMVIYYYRRYKVKKYINIQKEKVIGKCILLIVTLILYYTNTNIWIKFLNLLFVIGYACYNNKDIIISLKNSIKMR